MCKLLAMNRFRDIRPYEIENNLVNLRQLVFEVTDACNLKCKYCGYGDLYYGYDKRESKYLSVNKAKLLLNYLSNIWNSSITNEESPLTYISFYGGEPLLNIAFIKEIIAYVENLQLKRNILFSMTTNAMLLDKYMDFLVEKKFSLLISLDGNRRAQSYRVKKTTGENSFDKVISNVKALQAKYPKYFTEHVNFNSVLHNRNSVGGTYSFIKKNFNKETTISELNNSEIREDKLDEYDRTFRNKIESIKNSSNCEALEKKLFLGDPKTNDLLLFLHQYSGNVFKDYASFLVNPEKILSTNTGTCIPFAKKMFVTVNGKILQCERIDHSFSLGSVSENEVHLDVNKIAKIFNKYLAKVRGQCSMCYRKRSCIQCFHYIPDIKSQHPSCLGFMDKKRYDIYCSYCLEHLAKYPELYNKIMTKVRVD